MFESQRDIIRVLTSLSRLNFLVVGSETTSLLTRRRNAIATGNSGLHNQSTLPRSTSLSPA